MKTKNIFSTVLLTVIALFIASCEDVVEREPSPLANPNSTNVYFSDFNSSDVVLGLEDTSFRVAIIREKKDAAQVVALTMESPSEGIFTVPSSVSFAAGEDSVIIEVQVKDMEIMKDYTLSVLIDSKQTNPYLNQYVLDSTLVYSRIDLNLLKEDFVPYSEGTFTSSMFGDSWSVLMEFSTYLNAYRLNDLIEVGYDYMFSVDEGGVITQIPTTAVKTGYLHPSYGMMSYQAQAGSNFDAATDTYNFLLKYTVSAGSFGVKTEKYVVTKKF